MALVDQGDYKYKYTCDQFECPHCGALVENIIKHDEYHTELNKLIQATLRGDLIGS